MTEVGCSGWFARVYSGWINCKKRDKAFTCIIETSDCQSGLIRNGFCLRGLRGILWCRKADRYSVACIGSTSSASPSTGPQAFTYDVGVA